MRNIKIIEVRSEIGAGTRGASLGIDAIKIAALDFMSNLFVNFPSDIIENENRLLYEPIASPYAKRIQGIYTMYDRVSKAVCDTVKSGLFPLILAGDHSTSGATIAGLKMARPKRRLGIVWIDAHADMHSPYTTPSGNMHGMPLAISLAEDNIENQVHNPDPQTLEYWKKLKNIGKIEPKILPEDIVFISLRDFEKEEEAIIKKVPKYETFTRMQITGAYLAMQKRVTSFISLPVEERYLFFTKLYPDIVQRVPQHMIASYMGLTPETLSRVRKKIASSK